MEMRSLFGAVRNDVSPLISDAMSVMMERECDRRASIKYGIPGRSMTSYPLSWSLLTASLQFLRTEGLQSLNQGRQTPIRRRWGMLGQRLGSGSGKPLL